MQVINARQSAFWRRVVSSLIFLLSVVLLGTILQSLSVIEFEVISKLSKLSDGNQPFLKFLGFGIGGLVLILQALIANDRAEAMRKTAEAQATATEQQAKANELTERGLRQERLKNAIEHLGNESESVRLGAAYELFHLAEEAREFGQTVLDILCAHIRRTTRDDEYRMNHTRQPSEEIQSLLTLLFVQEHYIFSGLRIDLRESWLNGADLLGARLPKANLRRTRMNKAILKDGCLQKAVLTEAHLKEAWLQGACLREACLSLVEMQGANLLGAQLQGADIDSGNLTCAFLSGAHLQGAFLFSTRMYGATLNSAQMQGARLSWTYLQGAILKDANLQGAGDWDWDFSTSFVDRIRASIGEESSLSTVVDAGMARERVEQLANELLSSEKREGLKGALRPYINAPSRRGLSGSHGAILGPYTKEEAELWIVEHEAAIVAKTGRTR